MTFALVILLVVLALTIWNESVRYRGEVSELKYFLRTPEQTAFIQRYDAVLSIFYFIWWIPAAWVLIDSMLYMLTPYVTKNLWCTAGMILTSILQVGCIFQCMSFWIRQAHYLGLTGEICLPGRLFMPAGIGVAACIAMGSIWRRVANWSMANQFHRNSRKFPEKAKSFQEFRRKMGWQKEVQR